jgi:hypothetical protein
MNTTTVAPVTFRFDALNHEYIDRHTGIVYPHITGMLEATGWIDDTWFTEESCERGTAVHRLTADYDLGALDVESCVSAFRGYLLSHVAAMTSLRAMGLEVLSVEQPAVHPTLRFGGRPDRVIVFAGAKGILEGKSGAPERSHQIQTALQAILVADDHQLPAHLMTRYCLYWKANGKYKLEIHRDRRDFDEAGRIIRSCCWR